MLKFHIIILYGDKMPGPKKKSQKQVAYLLSKGSPLSGKQKDKLKEELHSGAVKVGKKKKSRKK